MIAGPTVVPLMCGHWTRRSECTGVHYDFCARCDKYVDIAAITVEQGHCVEIVPARLASAIDADR